MMKFRLSTSSLANYLSLTTIAIILSLVACSKDQESPNGPKDNPDNVAQDDKGQIHVLINGLPAGTNADITMTDSSGTTAITASQLFDSLKIGTYSFIAAEVRATDSEAYAPTPLQHDITLKPGDSIIASFDYARKYGRMNLSVLGLPVDNTGDVEILDPSGSVQGNYTASTSIGDLPPGEYTITAKPVTVNNTQYAPVPDNQLMTIVAGDDSAASVTYNEVLQYVDVRFTQDAYLGKASVTECWISDNVEELGKPIVRNKCDNSATLSSYLPFSGRADTSCLDGSRAWVDISIQADSAIVGKINIIEDIYAVSNGSFINSRANANAGAVRVIDVHNSLMDTLEVTLEWSMQGTGTLGPPGKGTANGTFGFQWYNNDCSLRYTSPFIDSSGVDAWSFNGKYVDTTAEAYTKLNISHDLICDTGGHGTTASAHAEISITVKKISK